MLGFIECLQAMLGRWNAGLCGANLPAALLQGQCLPSFRDSGLPFLAPPARTHWPIHQHPALPFPSQGLIFVDVDGQHVVVNAKSGKVQCADKALRERVERALGRMQAALSPLNVTDLGGV